MTITDLQDEESLGLEDGVLQEIEGLLNSPMVINNISSRNIDSVLANKYIADLYGLLHNEFDIPNEAIYINIRLNGYRSSLDYDGRLSLSILDPETFETILEFIQQKQSLA